MTLLLKLTHMLDKKKRKLFSTYPTDKTLPVSFKLASPEAPLILSSKIEETSVGAALAEANLLPTTCGRAYNS